MYVFAPVAPARASYIRTSGLHKRSSSRTNYRQQSYDTVQVPDFFLELNRRCQCHEVFLARVSALASPVQGLASGALDS